MTATSDISQPSNGFSLPGRRDVLFGTLLIAIGAGSVLLKPRSNVPVLSSRDMDRAIPRDIGRWHVAATDGLVMPPADELSAKLYDQVLTRIYQAPDQPAIALLIAYGRAQDAGLQLHRPDQCYPAQGFTLSNLRPFPVAFAGRTMPATITTATRNDLVQQVLYWTRIAQSFPADASAERSVIVAENLAGRMPDGVLIRLSVDNADLAAAEAALRLFVNELGQLLGPEGRRILLGSAAPTGTDSNSAKAETKRL